jgi:SAM-dependent methyltransferase
MKILNLGCGTKTSANPDVLNVDKSIYLRMKTNPLLRMVAPLVLQGGRRGRFDSLPDNVMVHNLAKTLPFATDSVDVVYHTQFLEVLDRDVAERFLLEVKRVLKPGGIQRIVVPDFEIVCRAYLAHLALCEHDPDEARKHDSYVAAIIEPSVRREAFSTSQQKPLRRFAENVLLGDARQRGETHQWWYDRINLISLLLSLGYRNPQLLSYNTSSIPNWERYGLDSDEHGNPYEAESLFIEAQK